MRLPALPYGLSTDAGRLPSRQTRQLIGALAILRWVGLVWVGMVGLLTPPRWPVALVLLILWIGLYNGWVMNAVGRASDESVHRVARLVTFLDQITYFVLVVLFIGVASGAVYMIYTFMLLEAVAFDGVRGAIQGVLLFVVGFGAVQGVRSLTLDTPFPNTDFLIWTLIFAFGAATFTVVDRILLGGDAWARPTSVENAGPSSVASARALRLSEREREVLRLVADGYSNAMIANRLHLSESTIKTHVESLLARLNVRNRAEAVAAAARLQLL